MRWAKNIRNSFWSVPIGLQLSLIYALLVATTLALLGWALYAQLDSFLVQNTAERLDQTTQAVLHRPLRPRSSMDDVTTFLVHDLSRSDVVVGVLDAQGRVLGSTQYVSDDDPVTVPALPTGWAAKVKDGSSLRWVVSEPGKDRQLVVLTPAVLSYDGLAQAPFFLEQAISLAGADAVLNQLRLYIVLGILVGTFVGIAAGLALTRVVLRPLDRMVRTAEAISGGDLDRRLHLPPGRNEVARLGGAFDHMVDRLAATLQAQRRFVADASHELRTPLTSLEGLSEMLLIGADRGDSRTTHRMARSIHSELGRMTRLVSDLLTLSRLDSATHLSVVPVDAGKLLDELAEQMAPVAESRQIHLQVAHSTPTFLRADPDRLKQVILNLIDNALRYTPPDGVVKLTVVDDPLTGMAGVQVQDTGPGIAPEDLPRIFDRFYRGDPSRSRASGNTGLGLAIVRAIVQAHGGIISVQSAPGAGACFTVLLPIERTNSPAGALPVRTREHQPVSSEV